MLQSGLSCLFAFSELSRRCILRIRLQGNKKRTGLYVQQAEADRNEQQHEQEQDCRGERTGRLLYFDTDRQTVKLTAVNMYYR